MSLVCGEGVNWIIHVVIFGDIIDIGCSFSDIWDEEDPANQGRPLFCEQLQKNTPPPFKLAFSNAVYRVLHVSNSNKQ